MNGGLDGEKDFFLGGMWMWVWMRACHQWSRREENGEGEMRGKEKREENWRQAVPPMALPIALHNCIAIALHCIGTTARRKMRASATIYGFAQEQSLAANLPSRQAIVTRRPKRLIMDDGGECKHAHL